MGMGRPTKKTPELIDEICAWIASGKSLHSFCREHDDVNISTVMRWVSEDEAFRERYERAREASADSHYDRIVSLSEEVLSSPLVDHNRYKIAIDAMKWTAARMKPKKYGDRVENVHANPDGSNLEISEIRYVVVSPDGTEK